MAHRINLPLAALLAAALLAAGCGQKGPLYLPGEEVPADAAAEEDADDKSTEEDTTATE
ncbi:MAG: lipoprotein [Gammaproteobacteria bacterium]|nr:lipoprotein [Gammaproteobacteria bacterium]